MAITQQTGRAASIDLLVEAFEIDSERFAAFSSNKSLSPADRNNFRRGRFLSVVGLPGISVRSFSGPPRAVCSLAGSGIVLAEQRGCAEHPHLLIFLGHRLLRSNARAVRESVFLACLGVGGMWPNGVALVRKRGRIFHDR